MKSKETKVKQPAKKKVPPKPGKGMTKAERLYRFRVVEGALRDGKRGGEIMDALHSLGRHVSWQQTEEYIADVRYKWEQEDAQVRPIWRERQLRKLHSVAAQLEGPKTWGHWIRLQELIAKIEGNFAPEKLDVTTRTDEFDGWTVEELQRYVESNGREIPLRFRNPSGGQGDSEEVPRRPGKGNGTAATLH